MEIKAIETSYNGYRMRSRIEARWAVFYDALGVDWRYEPEGYNLNGVYYLPDFYLPEYGFIEIKGAHPTKDEIIKCELLSNINTVFLFFGEIPEPVRYFADANYVDSAYIFYDGACADSGYSWCICKICGAINIQYGGMAARNCNCLDWKRYKGYNDDDPLLVKAYTAARSARFEHQAAI